MLIGKKILDIVLTTEEHKYVLNELCPNFPTLDASFEEKQRYDCQQKSNEMAKCYILVSISNVLQHQMQDVELASDIRCGTSFRHNVQFEGDVW